MCIIKEIDQIINEILMLSEVGCTGKESDELFSSLKNWDNYSEFEIFFNEMLLEKNQNSETNKTFHKLQCGHFESETEHLIKTLNNIYEKNIK